MERGGPVGYVQGIIDGMLDEFCYVEEGDDSETE